MAILGRNDHSEGGSGPALPRPVRGRTLTSANPPQAGEVRQFWNDRRCGRLEGKLERLGSKFAAKCGGEDQPPLLGGGKEECNKEGDSCNKNKYDPEYCKGLRCDATEQRGTGEC